MKSSRSQSSNDYLSGFVRSFDLSRFVNLETLEIGLLQFLEVHHLFYTIRSTHLKSIVISGFSTRCTFQPGRCRAIDLKLSRNRSLDRNFQSSGLQEVILVGRSRNFKPGWNEKDSNFVDVKTLFPLLCSRRIEVRFRHEWY